MRLEQLPAMDDISWEFITFLGYLLLTPTSVVSSMREDPTDPVSIRDLRAYKRTHFLLCHLP